MTRLIQPRLESGIVPLSASKSSSTDSRRQAGARAMGRMQDERVLSGRIPKLAVGHAGGILFGLIKIDECGKTRG
uniref:Uncharacterized protein n=1 Tax=Anguilla anguilla TaxID=7936 RepID=A0A0E9PGW0_ANGAN